MKSINKNVIWCKNCKKTFLNKKCNCEKDNLIKPYDKDGAFSKEFLLSLGQCCKNGCKNCPY